MIQDLMGIYSSYAVDPQLAISETYRDAQTRVNRECELVLRLMPIQTNSMVRRTGFRTSSIVTVLLNDTQARIMGISSTWAFRILSVGVFIFSTRDNERMHIIPPNHYLQRSVHSMLQSGTHVLPVSRQIFFIHSFFDSQFFEYVVQEGRTAIKPSEFVP